MKKLLLILAVVVCTPALASAQASGSFTYGTGGANGVNGNGVVGCVLDNHGTITGGGNNTCVVSSTGVCPVDTGPACTTNAQCAAVPPFNTCVSGTCEVSCTPGSSGNAACSSAVGSGSICTSSGFCSSTSCQFFTCTTNTDCLDIYGLNSGATCVNAVCQLPATNFPGGCMGSASGGIKTNSGNGNVFDIRPSAVIGLLTDVTVTSKQSADANGTVLSAALAGIDFTVDVEGVSGTPKPNVIPNGTVTYDARFVQISTNLFTALSSGCLANAGGCFLTFAESTVSAHSFDWIAGAPAGGTTLQSGEYLVKASWAPSAGFGLVANSIGEAMACVGPVNLTVSQNKIYKFNTPNATSVNTF